MLSHEKMPCLVAELKAPLAEPHGGKLGEIRIYAQEQRAWGARFGRAKRARRVRLRRKQPGQCNPTTRRLAIMNPARSLPRQSATTPGGIEADFSKEQWLQDCQYAVLPDHFTAKPGFFPAQVVGDSMNRRIPNGSWCLFREPSDGSRNGKVVIIQSRDIQDPDTGGQFTVKIYRSEKTASADSWSHRSIRLEPDSNAPAFQPLLLEADSAIELQVIGEFVAIAG